MEDGAFTAFFLSDGLVTGALTANRPSDMGIAKRLVERRVRIEAAQLADVDTPLREILRRATA